MADFRQQENRTLRKRLASRDGGCDGSDFRHHDFENQRLPLSDDGLIVGGHLRNEGQFHPLHRILDSSQILTMNQNLMGCEVDLQPLFLALSSQFGKDELIERQKQFLFR